MIFTARPPAPDKIYVNFRLVPGKNSLTYLTQPRIIYAIQKEKTMKLYVVFDPEQQEAVFIHPDFRQFKKFIKELREELVEFGTDEAQGCSDHDVLEMYAGWIGHIYDADWLNEGNW